MDEPNDQRDLLREELERFIGKSMSESESQLAPDPVNVPMIRHWVDALDDRNPVYLDEGTAQATRHRGVVAPPAMLQVWSMPRPKIEGIYERGGAPDEIPEDHPIKIFDRAGYFATLATNSELEFDHYLRPGDELESSIVLESISERKKTAIGHGYFVTWLTTYRRRSDGEIVGRQRFRILKFQPDLQGATE